MVNVKPVTLYDVAEYAGVSYQTVSRVVNQASHVSAKTREKVEAAMAELNYIPNRVAQQLAGKQSLLIGVATSSLALHAPSQIVAAIKSRADQLGASVVVSMVERSGVEACKAAGPGRMPTPHLGQDRHQASRVAGSREAFLRP